MAGRIVKAAIVWSFRPQGEYPMHPNLSDCYRHEQQRTMVLRMDRKGVAIDPAGVNYPQYQRVRFEGLLSISKFTLIR